MNSAEPPDTLTTRPSSTPTGTRFEYTGRHDRDAAELDAVRRLRPRLRALLTAERDDAVEIVNDLLARRGRSPGWSATTASTGTCTPSTRRRRWTERIAVETAMAMIDVIRADEMSRLGVCAQDDCERRPRPLAQPLEDLLRHHVQQPGRRGGLPRPQPLIVPRN